MFNKEMTLNQALAQAKNLEEVHEYMEEMIGSAVQIPQFVITWQHCQTMIDYAGKEEPRVCEECGGVITPIATTDNSGSPTFWPGCQNCQTFKNWYFGVPKRIYMIAKQVQEVVPQHFFSDPVMFNICRIVQLVLDTAETNDTIASRPKGSSTIWHWIRKLYK